MPYVFAHEEAFIIGVAVLIVALLMLRVGLARRRRQAASADSGRHRGTS